MLVSFRLEIVLILMQHRCFIGVNVTQAQKSFWTHSTELRRDEAQVETRFSPFGDSANFDAT
jgi:hypothetical protein